MGREAQRIETCLITVAAVSRTKKRKRRWGLLPEVPFVL
jgi:hypothetical protein